MASWDAKRDGSPKIYSIGAITITLSHQKTSKGVVPVLNVKAATGEEHETIGQVGFDMASATFGVGKLDPQSTTNQIIFQTFSGGAHCCTKIAVLELVRGNWRELDIGKFDGEGLAKFPTDIDGDGTPDIVVPDDRFAYAFASYAESYMPPRIFNLLGGSISEVSNAPRFSNFYRADFHEAQEACVAHNNGACAAFVADATRAGLRNWAWQIMLAHYNANSDWALPTECVASRVNGICPDGQEHKFPRFPDALDWFLQSTGYATNSVASSASSTPRIISVTGPIVDEAGLISPSARERIIGWLAQYERTTKRQVVVITVKSLQGLSIEDYCYQLSRAWGANGNEKNVGAILLVAPNDHKVRIEVAHGLEGELTNATSGTIINQDILPSFRQGKYESGIMTGTAGILRALGWQGSSTAIPPTLLQKSPILAVRPPVQAAKLPSVAGSKPTEAVAEAQSNSVGHPASPKLVASSLSDTSGKYQIPAVTLLVFVFVGIIVGGIFLLKHFIAGQDAP